MADARRITHCSACGGQLQDFSRGQCSHCGRVNDLDLRRLAGADIQAASEDSECMCPRCKVRLVKLRFTLGETFEPARCKTCLGLFFAPGELERLLAVATTDQHYDPARLERLAKEQREVWPISYIRCPVCPELMNRKNYSATIVSDWCKDHGVWLDGGELGRLLLWRRATADS